MSEHPAVRRARETGVVGIVRGADPDSAVDVVSALVEGGIRAVEVTADTPGITDVVADVTAAVPDDVSVGVGTVLDAETAAAVLRAGASFVVTPTYDEATVAACNRYGAPAFPGVVTPTEALAAYEAGAPMVKLFPASSVGPGHVSSVRGPLPQIPVVPTGGVGHDNAAEYIEAGAAALGVGSALVPDEALETEDYGEITQRAETLLGTVAEARDEAQ